MTLALTLNNNPETIEAPDGTLTVRRLLAAKGWTFPLIIVRVNGRLVERADWDSQAVAAGDVVDAMHLVSGG
ncbi:MAG: thiamine biosynthesis protein ThiS [Spirochaetes bacterium GWD1_61_31]|nr:MAG: thiamine biosynthesis protein ThiS [Spirochaetes bacterium GWB1_60_80]OHD31831.1 MAG: thiamine biosynthesis protein ThiS [Spirochaetes bacterium GWC1_61_12]OHD40074.1 MAG: thiamine biosynthesis protein ThiS [Spirochaetes bacterium GWD1_61_31]OHD45877.1 MAG: thiamine biosynthesis protein ThiS [Spirochaetes bacterium GWE1_60_18]OHD58421.1 MAG: thiamine biosynthesis protein ThiS [Spirochaetes bacterium GWF1_60_12]HAW85403.1 thiamine biosynthesis protein ThiS [Spirochaetaceae bacterium]